MRKNELIRALERNAAAAERIAAVLERIAPTLERLETIEELMHREMLRRMHLARGGPGCPPGTPAGGPGYMSGGDWL